MNRAVASILCFFLMAGLACAQVNPFRRTKSAAKGAVEGVIHMSDGTKYEGQIYLTPGRRLRLFDPKYKEYVDCSLAQLKELKVRVTERRVEKEWRFKAMGNDEKVYTGRTYARKDFAATLIYKSGRKKALNIARGMPIYCRLKNGERKTVLLQPFKQGEIGTTLDDIVHPDRIVFGKSSKDSDKGTSSKDKDTEAGKGAEKAPDAKKKPAEKNRKTEP